MAAPAVQLLGVPLRQSDYQKLLSESGIRPEWIDRAAFRRVDNAGGREALGQNGSGDYSGLLIPYFRPSETRPREYALRRDYPDIEYDSEGKLKQACKYLFPPGRSNILYFCPGTTIEQLADTAVPILLVEGVKKALACHQVVWDAAGDAAENPGFLTIALNGVWGWRGRIGKQEGADGKSRDLKGPIPDIERIVWQRRKVVIAFDTNVNTNEKVQIARSALTNELKKRGAVVHWLRWPADTPQTVNGLDDLLALQGPDCVLNLIRSAKPYRDSVPGVRIWTYTELLATRFPLPVPIAEDLLAEGETIAVVGKPKQGKSRLVQQLGIALSRGCVFLGHEVKRKRRVLILDLENRPSTAQSRFRKMGGTAPNDDLHIYAPESLMGNSLTLANAQGAKQLEQVVEDVRPEVLIIDNWRLFLGGDENKAEVIVNGLRVLSALRRIVPTLGIVIVHHIRKQQQGENQPRLRTDPSAWVEAASGHYAFVAHVDACFGLERENHHGDDLIVFAGVARNAAPRTLLLDEDEDTLTFRLANGADAPEQLFTPAELALWSTVRDWPDTFLFKDVVEKTGTRNRKAVASMLRKARGMNLISKTADHIYRVSVPA
jgi:hypothetical protein